MSKEEKNVKLSPPRGKYFSLVVYDDPNKVENMILLHQVFRSIAFIKHDKDTSKDNEGQIIPKPVHWHIIGVTPEKHTAKVITYALACYPQNVFCEYVVNRARMWNYLTHKDDPDKYQYQETDIYYEPECRQKFKGLRGDNLDFLEDLETLSPRQLAITYGRDYMKNYRQYNEFVRFLHAEETSVALPPVYREWNDRREKEAWSKYQYLLYKITPDKNRIFLEGTDKGVKHLLYMVKSGAYHFDDLDRIEINKQKTTNEDEYLNVISMAYCEVMYSDL